MEDPTSGKQITATTATTTLFREKQGQEAIV
jgi:hypothetical protein